MRIRSKDPFSYSHGEGPKSREVNVSVLSLDILYFSKNKPSEQLMAIRQIQDVLFDLLMDDYYWDERKRVNDLIIISSGDGYTIAFNPQINNYEILYIAGEIFKQITTKANIILRMGIAKGPCVAYIDMNDSLSLFGYGIKIAHRVTNLAMENQILVHGELAKQLLVERKIEDLIEIPGSYPIKHGENIRLYNYYKKGEFGNPNSPDVNKEK